MADTRKIREIREIALDAQTMTTREQAHTAFANAFAFPAEYGRNLDALYDLLCAIPPTRFTLYHPACLTASLGRYGKVMLQVLHDAAAENPSFQFRAVPEPPSTD